MLQAQSLPTLRLLLTSVVILASIVATTPIRAQQFLGFGRESCTGLVTVATVVANRTMVVRPLEYRSASVATNEIIWRCDNQSRPPLKCPGFTNIVQIDRRQSGRIFTFTCLRR